MILCIATALLYAQGPASSPEIHETPFDVNDIIEQISHQPIPSYTGSIAQLENAQLADRSRDGEFLIDTNVVYGPAVQDQGSPSVAFDGTNYLVVWSDNRCGPDIYGARVDQSGNILDIAGIVISSAPDWQVAPSVSFGGTNYLVVWQNSLSGSDIYGARVDTCGNVLDPAGIAISTAAERQRIPTLAFDGINYLVVWEDWRSDSTYDIYGARVDQSGNVLDPTGIRISPLADFEENPAVAFDGTNYLVAWEDWRSGADIYGARVDQSGNVLDTAGIAISTAAERQRIPTLAFDGINYLVVWSDERNGYDYDVYGARVDQSGNVLDPAGIAISTAAEGQGNPALAFDGTNYLVVWLDDRGDPLGDIYGARVDTSGNVLDPDGIAISTAETEQFYPSVASDGTNCLVTWSDKRNGLGFEDVYGARVDQSGSVLDPAGCIISIAANDQQYSSVASDGTNYLVVWQDAHNGPRSYDIYGARVDQSGNVLDPAGIPISIAAERQLYPSVASDGTNYLVVWSDERNGYDDDVYGARVDQSGNVLDPAGIPISTAASVQRRPSLAFDGMNYLVTWTDYRSGEDIYGARVDQSGNVLDPAGIPISIAVESQCWSSVDYNGTDYLVVWQDWRSDSTYDIYGARVDTSGNILDPAGIPISNVADWCPSVESDGTNWLVVWMECMTAPDNDIYGARVDQSGNVLDPAGIAISTAAYTQNSPSVTFDGTDYLIVWADYRSGLDTDIYGSRVNQSGTVIDSFAVSLQSGHQGEPALAHGPGAQLLIAYSGWTDSINTHPANTIRIWGTFYPYVGIEENAEFPILNANFNLMICPNPFNRTTDIRYQIRDIGYGIKDMSNTEIKIYDVTGSVVKQFDHQTIRLSDHIIWDGTNDSDKKLPSGVYFLKFEAEDYSATEKLLLIR